MVSKLDGYGRLFTKTARLVIEDINAKITRYKEASKPDIEKSLIKGSDNNEKVPDSKPGPAPGLKR